MSKSNNFNKYFKHLVEYQNQLLPDNKLSKDYVILYDYLMDLLEKDDLVGELLVRKTQQMSSLNADILLDLTKIFNIRSYIHEPFLCLTLCGRDNEHFTNILHPFCNKKLSVVPRKIKKAIWSALHDGLLKIGSFVRGSQGDIYELSISSNVYEESYLLNVNAYSDDVNLHINLRILLKYLISPNCESPVNKPYPEHVLNKEWLALVPRNINTMYEVCLPKLEYEMKNLSFELVMILRLIRFLFEKHKQLYHLDVGFVESIIYSEYMERIRGKKQQKRHYYYIFKGVLARIQNALKTKKCPCFWNTRLNLIKSFDNKNLFLNTYHEFIRIAKKFSTLKEINSSKYEDFFEFFDFKMESFSYEVDQFGIFKSY